MCCCCFKNCCWLCWFVFAVIISILVIATQAALLSYFGGPIPTQFTADGSVVLLFSNTVTIIFFIIAVIFLARDYTNLIAYSIILILLFFVVACSLFIPIAIYRQSQLDVEDVQEYAIQYSKDHNGAAPPFLEFVQKITPVCCGGEGFHDYVHPYPKNIGEHFSIPDSCCFKGLGYDSPTPGPGCGKGLTYRDFNTSYWLHHRTQEHATNVIKEAESPKDLFEKVSKAFAKEIKEKTNETLSIMKDEELVPTKANDPVIVPNREEPYLPLVIIEFIQKFMKESVEKTQPFYKNGTKDKMEIQITIDTNKEKDTQKFVKEQKEKQKVKVFGCAVLLKLAFEAKFIPEDIKEAIRSIIFGLFGFACFQAVLNFGCFVIYNYYYWKIIKKGNGNGNNGKVLPIQSDLTVEAGGGGYYGTGADAGVGAASYLPSAPPMTAEQIAASGSRLSTGGITKAKQKRRRSSAVKRASLPTGNMTPQKKEPEKMNRKRSNVKMAVSADNLTMATPAPKEVEKVKRKRSTVKMAAPADNTTTTPGPAPKEVDKMKRKRSTVKPSVSTEDMSPKKRASKAKKSTVLNKQP